MIIAFDKEQTAVIKQIASETELTYPAVMRQALRLYQLVHVRSMAGETFSFSGDAERASSFALADLDG